MQIQAHLLIGGHWRAAGDNGTIDVVNPATGTPVGTVARATAADIDEAAETAERGFRLWRDVSAYDRSAMMRRAAGLLRDRIEPIARILTLEQGKPLAEARLEILGAADMIDWLAEEGRRAYGRVVPGRSTTIQQTIVREPVGPVAAFAPWNFPVAQIARKLGSALATGCSIVVKAPEETPASPAALIQAFLDAGVPPDVIGLIYGIPSQISARLIAHPAIRKVTFTGSTAVGRTVAALAGSHMKRATMELGGHGPAIVCADADIALASKLLAAAKFRNAGQVCVSPTRLILHEDIHDTFLECFTRHASTIVVGDGFDPGVTMGPLAHARRLDAMERLVADARARGARVRQGGERIGKDGCFFAPTILTDLPAEAAAMNEEPFGPLALVTRFRDMDEAIAEANRLPYGLAAYGFTGSARHAARMSREVACGNLAINHMTIAQPEVPFGGVKDSGFGSEGGSEAIDAYLSTKLVTQSHP